MQRPCQISTNCFYCIFHQTIRSQQNTPLQRFNLMSRPVQAGLGRSSLVLHRTFSSWVERGESDSLPAHPAFSLVGTRTAKTFSPKPGLDPHPLPFPVMYIRSMRRFFRLIGQLVLALSLATLPLTPTAAALPMSTNGGADQMAPRITPQITPQMMAMEPAARADMDACAHLSTRGASPSVAAASAGPADPCDGCCEHCHCPDGQDCGTHCGGLAHAGSALPPTAFTFAHAAAVMNAPLVRIVQSRPTPPDSRPPIRPSASI